MRMGKPPFADGQTGTAFLGWKRKVVAFRCLRNCRCWDSWNASVSEVHPVVAVGCLDEKSCEKIWSTLLKSTRSVARLPKLFTSAAPLRELSPGRRAASVRRRGSERPWCCGQSAAEGSLRVSNRWRRGVGGPRAAHARPRASNLRPPGKLTASGCYLSAAIFVTARSWLATFPAPAAEAAAWPPRPRRCPFKARPARGSGARPGRWRHGAGGGALAPATAPAPRDGAAALPGRARPAGECAGAPRPREGGGRVERCRCGARPWERGGSGRDGERRAGAAC